MGLSVPAPLVFVFALFWLQLALCSQFNLHMMYDEPDVVEDGPVLVAYRSKNDGLLDQLKEALRDAKHRDNREIDRSSCLKKYIDLNENHTMCLVDVGVRDTPLTHAGKMSIINQHNAYRSEPKFGATNMLKTVWDEDLAIVAAKWARQCKRGHDPGNARAVPELPGIHVGQNAAYGYFSFHTAIKAWYDEVHDFKYGAGAIQPGKKIGHYTQVMSWRASRIGCGAAYCPNSIYHSKIHHICNYAGGQTSTDTLRPYETGNSCSKCSSKCSNNLCDCKGKLCLNGGTLNLATCTCACPSIYSGSTCQNINCPSQDPDYCGLYTDTDCKTYSNIPHICPQRCNLCPRPCNGLECNNLAHLDISTCTCQCRSHYSGRTCKTLSCPSSESSWCAAKSGADCKAYFNLPFDCPRACGKCTAAPKQAQVCNGKVCENSGVLNKNTCACKCQSAHYSGDRCELLTCPSKASPWCGSLGAHACTKWNNIPFECPVMCDKCGPKPCGGKMCRNYGDLNVNTCICKCPPNYTGDTCETLNCQKSDPWYCNTHWHASDCSYSNVPYHCVHMCNAC